VPKGRVSLSAGSAAGWVRVAALLIDEPTTAAQHASVRAAVPRCAGLGDAAQQCASPGGVVPRCAARRGAAAPRCAGLRDAAQKCAARGEAAAPQCAALARCVVVPYAGEARPCVAAGPASRPVQDAEQGLRAAAGPDRRAFSVLAPLRSSPAPAKQRPGLMQLIQLSEP
jgi:hypothetical protein